MNRILWGIDILSRSTINFTLYRLLVTLRQRYSIVVDPLMGAYENLKTREGIFCPAQNKLCIFKKQLQNNIAIYKSYLWSGISFCSPIAEDSYWVWNLHCKPQFRSSRSRFADGFVLLFVPYSAKYPSSLHSAFNIFHTVTTLNGLWNVSLAFKTRSSSQYCETIPTVNETVNVTYKMCINLTSLHFNGSEEN